MKGKCKKCVRYNPKALAHCQKAQSIYNVEKRHKINLSVTKCPEYLAPELVFKEPEPKEEPVTIGCTCEGYYKYEICDCEGDG
jgi:hypothetical protein